MNTKPRKEMVNNVNKAINNYKYFVYSILYTNVEKNKVVDIEIWETDHQRLRPAEGDWKSLKVFTKL